MNAIWLILQIIIGYNLLLPICFIAFYWLTRKKHQMATPNREYDYAIIVTAYQQTQQLPAVVHSLLKLNYANYIIYIVADNCNISGLIFEDPRVVLLKPRTTLASNVRSHLYAIANFKRMHEMLTIIDSDNLTDANYLNELNVFFDVGYEAIQGVRKAKNLDTNYARLDAARDLYYHFYDGEALFGLGSSATLSGSGMAFKVSLYVACVKNYELSGAGFDKVLQAKIVSQGKRIAYAARAIVYDQKTTHPPQLINQRSRWINSWFKYFPLGFNLLSSGLKKMNLNQFLFGLIVVRPPLFIFILLSALCLLINLIINPLLAIAWCLAFASFLVSFYIPLRHYKADPRIYQSLINIPKFIYYQCLSLFYAKNANRRSVATKHGDS